MTALLSRAGKQALVGHRLPSPTPRRTFPIARVFALFLLLLFLGSGLPIYSMERPREPVEARNSAIFGLLPLQTWCIGNLAMPMNSAAAHQPLQLLQPQERYANIGVDLLLLGSVILLLALLWLWAKQRGMKKSLTDRIAFEKLLAGLSAKLTHLPAEQVKKVIEENLAQIGEFLGLDRTTLFEREPNQVEFLVRGSWRIEGSPAAPTVIRSADVPQWEVRLEQGEPVIVRDSEAVPKDAIAERAFLNVLGSKSLVLLPLRAGDELFGAISFAGTKRRIDWTSEMVGRLTLIAEILSNALMRNRGKQVVHESEERFRVLANSAPVLMWMSGIDKKCTFCNQSWLSFTGRSTDQELGDGWAAGVHPDDLERCLRIYHTSFDIQASFEMEYRLRRFDGEYRWILDFGIPRFAPDGSFQGYMGSCVDITDRKCSEESLHALSGRLIGAQEEERSRIARELHDDFSQRMALLGIGLGQLWKRTPESNSEDRDRIADMLRGVREISSDIHSLSHQLHSSKLEHVGLVPAIQGLCREISEKYKINIRVSESGFLPPIPKDVALCLFRVTQEAIANVVKHSGSHSAEVQAIGKSDGVSVRISDLGIGFDPEDSNMQTGIGLVGMRERLRLVHGLLSVHSAPNRGTVIVAEVPLAEPVKESEARAVAAS